jgi:Protein of unknown function (DUF3309)
MSENQFRPAPRWQQRPGVHFKTPQAGKLTMSTILLIILILLLIGAMPAWPYSRSWGYAPTGGLGLIVVIVLILVLMGRI